MRVTLKGVCALCLYVSAPEWLHLKLNPTTDDPTIEKAFIIIHDPTQDIYSVFFRCVVSVHLSFQMLSLTAWPLVSLVEKEVVVGGRGKVVVSFSLRVLLCSWVAWRMFHFCVAMKWGQVNLLRSVTQDTVSLLLTGKGVSVRARASPGPLCLSTSLSPALSLAFQGWICPGFNNRICVPLFLPATPFYRREDSLEPLLMFADTHLFQKAPHILTKSPLLCLFPPYLLFLSYFCQIWAHPRASVSLKSPTHLPPFTG